ncbi:MAM and LDL-receptor class A domain-containing protein 2-like [Actinia tenebrosa]|uniref:MAM and LDL-receptor class A domain-containing protein 2-like n=1 Tax=Actinia tenebrosa TaxID=6105 RepID=A0A6P8HSD4_ACTTE|nr:MAM and LDL-receptor class A domain-containing protein 2-like [Actinia tenebrosa]
MILQAIFGLVLLCCHFVTNDAQSVGDCDFEGSKCHWRNAKGEDDFNWTRKRGRTASIITGPNRDHTTGYGVYLYIETSSPRYKGQVARLISPRMRGPQCMTLWYHMHGPDIGHLAIYANNNGSLRLLWLKGGEQGHYWHEALIDILETGEYKVEIDGVRGKSYRGDIAIDDIAFYPGVCTKQAPPKLYTYADVDHHGLMDQQGLPSPGPRSLQYGLHLLQEPTDKHDQFYLICKDQSGLRIIKTEYIPRQTFPCEPRDFFYSSNSNRRGLYPFFVVDKGKSAPQMISLKNDTTYCSGPSSVTQLFAASIELSVNLAYNSSVSLSSHVPGFNATFVIDGDYKTCAKTLKQDNPWLEMKLSGSQFIYKVYVSTRQNCSYGDHLPNITVRIYDQNIQVSCKTTDQRAKKTSRVFLCQPPLRAHKVRIENHGKQIQLSLCEVIVNAVDSLEHLQGVKAETWRSISYSDQLLTFIKSPKRYDSPDISETHYEFFDEDFGLNNYGQRLTSFIQAPDDGRYKFFAMCDDQCKVWMKYLKSFSDVFVVEDLEYKEQELLQLIFVTRYTGYGRWSKYSFQTHSKDLDSCHMYMLETSVKDSQGRGYIGVGWKTPNGVNNRPLSLPSMFWILPGLQMLNTTLLEPPMKQRSVVVGQTMKILMSYRLCCHGIYCPASCSKSVRLQLLGYTFVVNSSLSTTCQWYNYTTSFVIENHPGKYDIKVLESTSNTSINSRTIRDLEIKARVLQSCFYQDDSCSWTIKGDGGYMGWVVEKTANNKGLYMQAEANTTALLQSPIVQPQLIYRSIGLCLEFSYRNNHESSQLEVIVYTLYNQTVLWHLKGMQGSQWNEAAIPWPAYLISQIQIRGNTDTKSSVAVSDIRLSTIKCSLTPKHATSGHVCEADEFQCHNGECVKSKLRCDGDYACVDQSDERNCACRSSEYECPDGKCLAITKLCNGIKECADGSDEAGCGNVCNENQFSCLDGSCLPWSVTCDGVWDCKDGSDEPDICSSLRCPLNNVNCASITDNSIPRKQCRTFRGPCNFEYGFCGLTTNATNRSSKAKWQIMKGQTPTSETGPLIDHTRLAANGSYLYLEVSGLVRDDAAQLYSDWIEYTNVTCLQFWYHMWGRHVGDLNVYIMTNQTRIKMWSRSGDAGPKWRFGQTTIYNNGSSFKFIYEATAGNGNEGDIAIDDVDLITGKCDLSHFGSSSCNFDRDFCNWKSNAGWVLQSADSQSTDVPARDKQTIYGG